MKYITGRDSTYLFTVSAAAVGSLTPENFFKELRAVKRSHRLYVGDRFTRYGRNRNRKAKGLSREHGHVPLADCDRWDLYMSGCNQADFIRFAMGAIRRFGSSIEYANVKYQKVIDSILDPSEKIVNPYLAVSLGDVSSKKSVKSPSVVTPATGVLPPYKKVEPPVNTWRLTAHLVVKSPAADIGNLERSLVMGTARIEQATAESYEMEQPEQHTELPLVEFEYKLINRRIRVISRTDDYIFGFDVNDHYGYKKFRVDTIRGPVNLIKFVPGQS